MSTPRLYLAVVIGLSLASCGEEDAPADPRCAALCAIASPTIEGAGDICSQVSAEACIAECNARIVGTPALCASCLLEEACFFDCGDDAGDPVVCDVGGCELSGREGTCTYPDGDIAAYEACQRQVNPLREVSCTADYRPVVECAALCQDGGS